MSRKRELTPSERRQAGLGCSILVILFLVIGFFSVRQTMHDAMCTTTTFAEGRSPSGSMAARVQMTDCGALSGFSRVVWVQPAWLPQDRVFSCRAVALEGQPSVALNWSADTLIITTNAAQRDVIQSETSCYGWPIELRLVPSGQ